MSDDRGSWLRVEWAGQKRRKKRKQVVMERKEDTATPFFINECYESLCELPLFSWVFSFVWVVCWFLFLFSAFFCMFQGEMGFFFPLFNSIFYHHWKDLTVSLFHLRFILKVKGRLHYLGLTLPIPSPSPTFSTPSIDFIQIGYLCMDWLARFLLL